MIKNLPDDDEKLNPNEQKAAEEIESIAAFVRENIPAETSESEEKSPVSETTEGFKISENAGFFKKEKENLPVVEEILPNTTAEQISALQPAVMSSMEKKEEALEDRPTENSIGNIFSEEIEVEKERISAEIVPIQTEYDPLSTAETIRHSGLAWSAGIVLFGSVVFMLIVGWFVDLILGSSPIGIVGGIVLGSVIGFIQFFRITSQIFKNQQ
jgi:F0F1-type ATP synthase assembly protein I